MKNKAQAALDPLWQKRLLSILARMEQAQQMDTVTVKALSVLLYSGDFALTFRTLIYFNRLRVPACLPHLSAFFNDGEQPVYFRLLVLEALCQPLQGDMSVTLAALRRSKHPLLERGLIVALGMQGRSALPYLAEFTAIPALYLRQSVLTEALFLAAGSRAALAAYAAKHQQLRRYLRYRCLPEDGKERHYRIMPAPDYLLQAALENGLTKEVYKALLHRI